MRRVEAITGSADLGEAVRWWLDWGEDYARWLLRRLGIDPKDLVA
jgi:hypothetical protein